MIDDISEGELNYDLMCLPPALIADVDGVGCDEVISRACDVVEILGPRIISCAVYLYGVSGIKNQLSLN